MKSVYILFFMLFYIGQAFAQKNQVGFELTPSMNVDLKGRMGSNYNNVPTLSFGFVYERRISDDWGFETGLKYFRSSYEYSDLQYNYYNKSKLSSISVPIKACYYVGSARQGFVKLGTTWVEHLYRKSESSEGSLTEYYGLGTDAKADLYTTFELGYSYPLNEKWTTSSSLLLATDEILNPDLILNNPLIGLNLGIRRVF